MPGCLSVFETVSASLVLISSTVCSGKDTTESEESSDSPFFKTLLDFGDGTKLLRQQVSVFAHLLHDDE